KDVMRAPDVRVLTTVSEVPRADWDALLSPASTPFVCHAWLQALERSGCAAARTGWDARHLTLWRGTKLIAAAPAYAKDDSDGDFSRDWDLAASLSRSRIGYYPKLALTVPFTPCTGERVLVAPGEDRAACVARIVGAARKLCDAEGYPTWQVLFPDEEGARELEQAGMALRVSWQFHWRNEGYRSLADFLARFNSKRRHMLRREMVAGAFNVASATRLYGRYWGCFEEHPFLHFNVCYYHSIADCIARRLEVFEGGAGGEHKLARGFLPTLTWSAHGFSDAQLDG